MASICFIHLNNILNSRFRLLPILHCTCGGPCQDPSEPRGCWAEWCQLPRQGALVCAEKSLGSKNPFDYAIAGCPCIYWMLLWLSKTMGSKDNSVLAKHCKSALPLGLLPFVTTSESCRYKDLICYVLQPVCEACVCHFHSSYRYLDIFIIELIAKNNIYIIILTWIAMQCID